MLRGDGPVRRPHRGRAHQARCAHRQGHAGGQQLPGPGELRRRCPEARHCERVTARAFARVTERGFPDVASLRQTLGTIAISLGGSRLQATQEHWLRRSFHNDAGARQERLHPYGVRTLVQYSGNECDVALLPHRGILLRARTDDPVVADLVPASSGEISVAESSCDIPPHRVIDDRAVQELVPPPCSLLGCDNEIPPGAPSGEPLRRAGGDDGACGQAIVDASGFAARIPIRRRVGVAVRELSPCGHGSGYLTRANVAALRERMDWPGCAFEERRRAGKRLGEVHVGELRLVRALLDSEQTS